MFVADEQGVFLKAAGCPVRPPFHLGGPASWAGTKLPAVEFFFSIKTRGKRYPDPLVCPGSSQEQRRCYKEFEVREVIVTRPPPPAPPVSRLSPGARLGWRLALERSSRIFSVGLNLLRLPLVACGGGGCLWCS